MPQSNRGRVTIREVAAKAGVSIATVSNVFGGTKPVTDDVRKRVEEAAHALSYHPNRAASQLRKGQGRVVGVLVPDLDDVFFTSLVSRIEVMAGRDGYDVIIASSRDDKALEESRLRALFGWRLSGLIAVPCSDVVPSLLRREVDHLPMVLVDRVGPEGAFVDTVAIDNHEAGEIAARHLLDLGHREIVVAASTLAISPIRERVRGIEELMRGTIGTRPAVIELGSNRDAGTELFAGWVERHSRPFAVVGLTNVTTLSALSALARHEIDIPDPVSVIGFDDYPWMSARRTGLTAIRQPIEEMAKLAWERLCARMAGGQEQPQRLVLKTSLSVRDSVRAIGVGEGLGGDAGPVTEPRNAIH
jgi:LacI family transcriptional regulator